MHKTGIVAVWLLVKAGVCVHACARVCLCVCACACVCTLWSCCGLQQTLEMEIRRCSCLVLWTDGDREGEDIAYEIASVCQGGKTMYNLLVISHVPVQ